MTQYGDWQQAGDEGIKRKIFRPGKAIMSMLIEFKAGASGPAHAHPHEQITFVIRGGLSLTVEGAVYELRAGEQMYIARDAVHAVAALEDSLALEVFTPLRDDLLATVTES